jgi:L-lactate dehydrogenase complex protein LldG
MNASREKILNRIKQALETPMPVPFKGGDTSDKVFLPSNEELEIEFAENFTKLQGKFIYCTSWNELIVALQELSTARNWTDVFCSETALQQQLQQNGFTNFNTHNIANCHACITTCEQLIARTGSILLSSANQSGRTVSVYAPIHICIATTKQLVYDIKDGLKQLQEKYGKQLPSFISLATGPSRTADIEKTLVVGVHGPKEVFCFLVEE